MSHAELKTDQMGTYDALLRMIEADRTKSKAFTKLVERLEWVNNEMVKKGHLDPKLDDAKTIREAWLS